MPFSPKLFFIPLAVSYLVLSALNFRENSWDGLNNTIRYVQLLAADLKISYFEAPITPHLAEYFLGIFLKIGSLGLVNFAFGAVSLCVLFLVNDFYKKLGASKKVRVLSLIIFATSPIFLQFAFREFKIDFFLVAVSTLGLLIFLRLLEKVTHKDLALFGTVLALSFLIKTSFSITIVFLLAAVVFKIFTSENLLKAKLFQSALLGFCFATPIMLWGAFFGLKLPVVYSSSKPFLNYFDIKNNFANLERKESIVNACLADQLHKDYRQFFDTDNFLLQPYNYLLGNKFNFFMSDPGFFLYFSILLFPFAYKLYSSNKNLRVFYWIVLGTLALFFINVRSAYWYLLPVLPIISMLAPLTLEQVLYKHKSFVTKTILSIGLAYVTLFVVYFLKDINYKRTIFDYPHNKSTQNIHTANTFLESISHTGLILNAAEHPDLFLYPYLKDSDLKIIPSNYYFVASEKSSEKQRAELVEKGIKYIIVLESSLDSSWHQGCARENAIKTKEFLAKHTRPIYSGNLYTSVEQNLVFEII